VVTERAQPPFRYELRHRRLADAALRELEIARAGRGGAATLLLEDDEPPDGDTRPDSPPGEESQDEGVAPAD